MTRLKKTQFHGMLCDDGDARAWTMYGVKWNKKGRVKLVGSHDMTKDRGILPGWFIVGRP